MTDAAALPDRTTQMLDLLAEMDLAAAQHVHAQLLATTEPAEVATLARAYQRASRGLRQVLMLKMKHEKDRAEAAARAAGRRRALDLRRRCARPHGALRTEQLQDAVGRVAAAAWPDKPRLQREALDRLDVLIDDWLTDDDEEKLFLDRLDDLVIDACERLDLPLALARQWENLPTPAQTFDPATAPPGEVPHADTG
jgi:hypothetical protein